MWFQRIFSPAKAQKVHSGLPGEQVNGLQVSARALIQLNRLNLNSPPNTGPLDNPGKRYYALV